MQKSPLLKRLIAGTLLLALAGCASQLVEPTTPSDLFSTESEPYGTPSMDPYVPYGPKALVEIPTGPKPAPIKPPPPAQ